MDFFKKNKVAGSIIILLVILNIVLISLFWFREFRRPDFSYRRDLSGRERPERMIGFFQHELGFNTEQTTKFTELRQAFFEEMKPIMKQIHDLRMALNEAIFNEHPDENKVRDLISQISELEQKRELAMFNHIGQVRGICTAEQRLKLKNLMRDVFRHNRPDFRADRPEHRKEYRGKRP